jgi:hypothetical protein
VARAAVPPEAIEEEKWHVGSDIWALACTVVEMMIGGPPRSGATPYGAMYHACKVPYEAQLPDGLSDDGRCAPVALYRARAGKGLLANWGTEPLCGVRGAATSC